MSHKISVKGRARLLELARTKTDGAVFRQSKPGEAQRHGEKADLSAMQNLRDLAVRSLRTPYSRPVSR